MHLKKGDTTWFRELLDAGLVPPGLYGKYGHVEMNRPYFDGAVKDLKPAAPPKRLKPAAPPKGRGPPFIPSARFKGARAGYVFKAGSPGPAVRPGHPSFVPPGSGLGYYLDSGGASAAAEVQARGGWEAMWRRGDVVPRHLWYEPAVEIAHRRVDGA